MDKDSGWRVINQERAALADLLERLTPEEWERPSLCEGWSVRDVAAHVIAAPELSVRQLVVAGWRARGNVNRAIHDEAERLARRPTEEIVADFRRLDWSRRPAPGLTYHEALLDILVHFQDIAIPLGRSHDMPLDAAACAADRARGRLGLMFGMKRKLAGYRLQATDTDWAAGKGALVRGPIAALLLLLTGRPALVSSLEGDGVPQLRQRLEATP